MNKNILNHIGRHAAGAVVGGQLAGSRLNMKLGFALLKDRRIGIWPKLLALALGAAGAGLLIALEISPEAILAAILPGLGLALDFAADGMEAVLVPFLLAALILPFVVSRHLVDQIMMERGAANAPALPPAVVS